MTPPTDTSGTAIRPAYRALAAALRQRIEAGEFPPDHRLPTEAELTRDTGLSRQTIRQAFSALVSEGLVYRIPSRGTFVLGSSGDGDRVQSFLPTDLALPDDIQEEVLEPFAAVVNDAAADRLRLESTSVFAGRFRLVDTRGPLAVIQMFVPPEIGPALAANARIAFAGARSSPTVNRLLEEVVDGSLAGVHQRISAVSSDGELSRLIECDPGAPLLCFDRIHYDMRGRFVAWTITHFDAPRYSYTVDLRRVARR